MPQSESLKIVITFKCYPFQRYFQSLAQQPQHDHRHPPGPQHNHRHHRGHSTITGTLTGHSTTTGSFTGHITTTGAFTDHSTTTDAFSVYNTDTYSGHSPGTDARYPGTSGAAQLQLHYRLSLAASPASPRPSPLDILPASR